MNLFPKKKPSLLHRVQMRLEGWGIIKKETFASKHALHFLNISQFLGVINDNVFKFLVVFLFISIRGVQHSSSILFWVGTVYVLPFLLFSSAAGVLADRLSKQRLIILLKLTELIIMSFGVVALATAQSWACYTLLFLLSAQSAFFGPPKYSIIPELVRTKDISKANGLITSSTYLGVIVGTTLATTLTQLTDKNWAITGSVTVVVAFIGFIASICIPKTPPKRSSKRINPFFIYEIYKTLLVARKWPFLLTAIFGASSFLFVGAYFQLNIIPFAIESLGLTEVYGGYLFLITAIGIAAGSMVAGKVSNHRVEVGMACWAGLGLSLSLFLLSFFAASLPIVIASLILIGFIGGLFIVPFDSYIQTFSPDKERGRVVAAANFLSFIGVLLAPLCIITLNGGFELSAAQSFAVIGVLFFLFAIALIVHLTPYFFNFLARIVVRCFVDLHIVHFPHAKRSLLVFQARSFAAMLLLASYNHHIRFYTLSRAWWWFMHFFAPVRLIKKGTPLLKTIKHEEIPCFFGNPAEIEIDGFFPHHGHVQSAHSRTHKKSIAIFFNDTLML